MPKHKMCVSRQLDCRAFSGLDQSQTLSLEALHGDCNNHRCQAVMAQAWLCCSPVFCRAGLSEPSQQILLSENVPHPAQGKACYINFTALQVALRDTPRLRHCYILAQTQLSHAAFLEPLLSQGSSL